MPDLEVVISLLEGVEPDERADDYDRDGVCDQGPVQEDERCSDMIFLHNSEDGDDEGQQQEYTKDHTSCCTRGRIFSSVSRHRKVRRTSEVRVAQSEIDHQIRHPPHQRHDNGQDSRREKPEVDKSPESHEPF